MNDENAPAVPGAFFCPHWALGAVFAAGVAVDLGARCGVS